MMGTQRATWWVSSQRVSSAHATAAQADATAVGGQWPAQAVRSAKPTMAIKRGIAGTYQQNAPASADTIDANGDSIVKIGMILDVQVFFDGCYIDAADDLARA